MTPGTGPPVLEVVLARRLEDGLKAEDGEVQEEQGGLKLPCGLEPHPSDQELDVPGSILWRGYYETVRHTAG